MTSDSDVVLLSLLAEQPRHGYDLDRIIEQRGYRQWTSLASSSVYYVLGRLADRGLIEPVGGTEGRRTVFRVTRTGRRELGEAAGRRLAVPTSSHAGALPALGAYARLDDPELLAVLARRAVALEERIEVLRRVRQSDREEHARAIVAHELLRHEADLVWTRSLLEGSIDDATRADVAVRDNRENSRNKRT